MPTTSTKTIGKLTTLKLVYPPISSQESVWLSKIPAVKEQWKKSDFYMIAARAEGRFENIHPDIENCEIHFEFQTDQSHSASGQINAFELDNVVNAGSPELSIELGPKLVRIWNEEDSNTEPLDWFTTEKFLWDVSRGHSGIEGFANYRELAVYDLLYVGIAKSSDSYERLFKNGHETLQTILSNEPQRYPGARPTDEIFLFLFSAQPLFVTTFEPNHPVSESDFEEPVTPKAVIADAEKAFVSMLQPDYNKIKFKNYPKGTDGLYNSGIERYGYQIGENISFRTANGTINGGWNNSRNMISNSADNIFVDGDVVTLFKSGTDYPSDDLV